MINHCNSSSLNLQINHPMPSFLLFITSLFLSLLLSTSALPPKALVLPVTKDSSSLQYVTRFSQRTPLVPVKLTVDVGGQFLWVDCDNGYISSSYKSARCRSAQCSLAKAGGCGECFSPPKPGCSNDSCSLFPGNTVNGVSTIGEVSHDVVALRSTDGFSPGRVFSVPNSIFICGSTFLLKGLANGVVGMAGFGRTKISLPSLFSAAFNFDRKFSICLGSNGVIFFGNGPYVFLPDIDASKHLVYTPLLINPVSTAGVYSAGDKSSEYFIEVKSIKIGDKMVPLNASLLTISNRGYGGTKISSVNPYTVMETSIYNAVVGTFVKQLSGVPRVASISPFGACFDSKNLGSTRVGPPVPQIDLGLQNNGVWSIFGANSMVQVRKNVMCLGIVDGGVEARTAMVIGGHQLENNLLEFDLARSRLGLTSSLLFYRTSCSNFNFTNKA